LLGLGYAMLRPDALPVDVGAARRGPLRVTIDEEGETRVRERFVVAAPTTGRLLRIALDEGAALERGAVVAHVQPAPLGPRDLAAARAHLEAAEATQRAAEARVVHARAALEQAQRSAARAERLHRSGTLSDDAREQAVLARTRAEQEHEAARFSADAADHEVEAARAALIAAISPAPLGWPGEDAAPCNGGGPCIEVRTPVAGRVLRVLEESERIVAAGTPLIEVGDPATLEIVIDILSEDAVRVRPGASVRLEDWGGDGALEARVRLVEPSAFTKISALGVEEQRVNVIADLVEPESRLGDRYRVEAGIVVWEESDVLQIPASALFRSADRWNVFVVDDGRAVQREVEVGHQASFETEVRSGLEPGERVVLNPSDRVRDGSRVVAR
jgi:HlyD family secretion protein